MAVRHHPLVMQSIEGEAAMSESSGYKGNFTQVPAGVSNGDDHDQHLGG